MLRIGRFENFKGGNSVLLCGSADDITSLSKRLANVVAASMQPLAVHGFAKKAQNRPQLLIAVRSIPRIETKASAFWLCNTETIKELLALAKAGHGHQYFALQGNASLLVVSVGEYDENWWEMNG
jgi:hypothetical protein